METDGCTFKYLNAQEIHRTEYSNNSGAGEVYLSPERQEQIKRLMFSALEDPREKYKKITVDEMTEKWLDPKVLEDAKAKTIASN